MRGVQQVPVGVKGELCRGGVGVARGYLNQVELTAEKFVESPFVSGDRLYRTGDTGRWLMDGNIEFLGRRDEQVKVRGYRIELGEIEGVLSGQVGVRGCCVVVREDRLVGYVVMEGGGGLTGVVLEAGVGRGIAGVHGAAGMGGTGGMLPLTANGKTDRKGLPDPLGIGWAG